VNAVPNRSQDAKGTITTVTMVANQQDYKWKAYVGNISGALALDDASGKSIYDWTPATITGELYATRQSSVSWNSVACVNQSVIDNEQASLGIGSNMADNINSTFNNTAHKSFLVGTINISQNTCRSTATYINDAPQSVGPSAFFQEILLKDNSTSSMIYTTLLETAHTGFNGASTFNFQLIVAENESSNTPTPYFFYVELG
jgi:glutathionylspermidine synthase